MVIVDSAQTWTKKSLSVYVSVYQVKVKVKPRSNSSGSNWTKFVQLTKIDQNNQMLMIYNFDTWPLYMTLAQNLTCNGSVQYMSTQSILKAMTLEHLLVSPSTSM